MSQKVAQEVGLSQAQINVILHSTNGYPTFAQRSSGRFRCNQAPELGLLKPRHLSSIRAQVGANRKIKNASGIEKIRMPAVYIDDFGDARCPRCAHWKLGTLPNKIEICNFCGMEFKVIM